MFVYLRSMTAPRAYEVRRHHFGETLGIVTAHVVTPSQLRWTWRASDGRTSPELLRTRQEAARRIAPENS